MKKYFNVIKWEVILSFKEYMRYRIGLIMDFIIFTGIFIGIYFFNISEGFSSVYNISDAHAKILVLIGYIFWQNSTAALGYCTQTISSETSRGIFEMRLQSKYSMQSIWFFRLLISCFIHLVTYLGIIIFGSIFVGFHSWDIMMILLSILMSFIALIGMYGIGLIFGSFSVREKNVGALILIIQTLLLFITNTLSPSRSDFIYLVPFSAGIEIMRNLYLHNPVSGELVAIFCIVNVVWLIVGSWCFKLALKHEKKYGSFDTY